MREKSEVYTWSIWDRFKIRCPDLQNTGPWFFDPRNQRTVTQKYVYTCLYILFGLDGFCIQVNNKLSASFSQVIQVNNKLLARYQQVTSHKNDSDLLRNHGPVMQWFQQVGRLVSLCSPTWWAKATIDQQNMCVRSMRHSGWMCMEGLWTCWIRNVSCLTFLAIKNMDETATVYPKAISGDGWTIPSSGW